MSEATRSALADWFIIWFGFYLVILWLSRTTAEVIAAVVKARARRKRMRDHTKWVAARVAARNEVEARLRAEGRWDNYEIQDAMDAAGQRAVPGFRP